MRAKEAMRNSRRVSIVVVCDFKPGLTLRILGVYAHFRSPPRVILVQRNSRIPPNLLFPVKLVNIPLPVRRLWRPSFVSMIHAACRVVGYMMCLPVAYFRIRCRADPIQLVHAHFVFPQGFFGLILSRLLRVPFLISVEGSDVNILMRASSILRTVTRLVLSRADRIIAVSVPLHRTLLALGIRNSVYLPNSVDTASIAPGSQLCSSSSVLFVGSMVEGKRPLLLVRAFSRIVARVPNAALVMCGDGPLKEKVLDEIRERNLSPKVKLFAEVDPSFVVQLLRQAQVFVLPSQSEGMSLALLEAMASGKVIVASANESHKALLRHGDNALLFHLDDEADLAGQLLSALTDEELGTRLSQSARALCLREYSSSRIGPKLESIYLAASRRSTLQGNPGHAR